MSKLSSLCFSKKLLPKSRRGRPTCKTPGLARSKVPSSACVRGNFSVCNARYEEKAQKGAAARFGRGELRNVAGN
eukprot:6179827-Pleurochrysis_carterae.AAC.2